MTELDKLELMLKERGVPYKRYDEDVSMHLSGGVDYSRHRIDVYENEEDRDSGRRRIWDAIYQYGSYGFNDSLLEVMGEAVVDPYLYDSVEGWLTAEQVMKKWDDIRTGNIEERACFSAHVRIAGTEEESISIHDADMGAIGRFIEETSRDYILIPKDYDMGDFCFIGYARKKESDPE